MKRYCGTALILLISGCGGSSTSIMDPVTDVLPEPTIPEVSETPITFVAGAFEEGFSKLNFADRSDLGNTAIAVANSLTQTDLNTLGATGTANYDGLIQIDYNGYTDGFFPTPTLLRQRSEN